jgi:hypothetical protein
MTSVSRRESLITAAAAVVTAAASSRPAVANGDIFFEALEIEGDPQFVFFGSVKNRQGKGVPGALVSVGVSEPQLTYESYTNIIGRYRSLDVGRVIQDLGYDIDPSKIDVEVFVPGYKTARKFSMRRTGDVIGAFEVNFVIEEEEDAG